MYQQPYPHRLSQYHDNPPSQRIKEIFELGKSSRSYNKARDAKKIL
jgi:hypothetical protein